jgi:hypothetical protein
MLAQILMVFAFVFAVIAAIFVESVPAPPIRVHFGWLALAFFLAAMIFGGFKL